MKDRIRTRLPFQGAPVGGACGFWRRLTRLKIVLGTIVSTRTLFICGLGLIPLCPLDGANRQEENNEGPNERNPGTCAIQWNSISSVEGEMQMVQMDRIRERGASARSIEVPW